MKFPRSTSPKEPPAAIIIRKVGKAVLKDNIHANRLYDFGEVKELCVSGNKKISVRRRS